MLKIPEFGSPDVVSAIKNVSLHLYLISIPLIYFTLMDLTDRLTSILAK